MFKRWVITLSILITAIPAFAKVPVKIAEAINSNYPPAEYHKALDTAFENPDTTKLRGYVVLLKGGIPAERARFFISWDEYDYRGAVVDLSKGGEISTRRGKPYTYLQPGDILSVAGMNNFSNTIYLKLLTPDVYIPGNRKLDKKHSRVTVMLGFKFPSSVMKGDDAEAVIKYMSEWLKPFSNLEEAKVFARGISAGETIEKAAEEKIEVGIIKKGQKSGATNKTDAGNSNGGTTSISDQKLKSLEDKIDAAKKQMEEAEKEMKKLRGGK